MSNVYIVSVSGYEGRIYDFPMKWEGIMFSCSSSNFSISVKKLHIWMSYHEYIRIRGCPSVCLFTVKVHYIGGPSYNNFLCFRKGKNFVDQCESKLSREDCESVTRYARNIILHNKKHPCTIDTQYLPNGNISYNSL